MASKTGATSGGKSASETMVQEIARQMRQSILPGDTPFSPSSLKKAAQFVLDTAAAREPDRSALGMVSIAGDRRFLRIAIINDDMPFLVDSIAATISAQGLSIDRLVHPIVPVTRDKAGKLTGVPKGKDAEAAARESMIYIETERCDARQRRELEKRLRTALGDVRAAVQDWPKLQAAMAEDAKRLADEENGALLEWFNTGMLTQLGHLTRKRDGSLAQILGICRKSARQLLADNSYDRAFAWFDSEERAGRPSDLLIVKANRVSNVHRRVPLDLFIVPLREDGKLVALSIHAGVWTSAALASPPHKVPRLSHTLSEASKRLGFHPGGHADKALVHAFTALPHDLLVGATHDDAERLATAMMSLVDRPRPRLVLVEAPLARHVFAFVWFPRDMVSTQVRERIEAMLTRNEGTELLDWSLEVEGGNLAMLRFVLDIRSAKQAHDESALEAELQDMLRGWNEAVERQLTELDEPSRAPAIAARYAPAFPVYYRTDYGAHEAAIDICRLRRLVANDSRERDVRLCRLPGDPSDRLRLKVYQQHGALPLSDAVPALENFGFRVLTELPTSLEGGELGTIHDFTLALGEGENAQDLLSRADIIEDAIAAVLSGEHEDDPFNRLVTGTGLLAHEANWLRAFYRYLRQTGMSFTIYTVVDALGHAPQVTREMIALLCARHDPAFKGDREEAAKAARDGIRKGLAKVSAINDDRLLRLYQALIEAILRTNAFAPASEEALAFKIDSALIPNLPKPVPWREIWVYSRRVEGIHLRAGPIARGGLRWSDRRDDFRTEILGLMKAQKVKNAVIVPSGAKGGFYPKQLPSPQKDRAAWAEEGQASYEIFIRTLLSVTDNIVKGKVVHPDGVRILDGEDPYFVVAADKGTARFSDVANGIAQKKDFWLGDAFASGGSNGYDHKAMGITAKGAWVSVQRHFLEMGVDVQSEPVRVVGCGDMSGDVFGNGMLLSKAIKLVAAFDHRHIFIDPDPDPAKSWKERQRLYDLPQSSWEDYKSDLISKGGGVFPRSAKSIKLSKQARDALGIVASEVDPDTLINAILKSPVDLIWFGGIGTYIKAESENNVQVGDPANDALRVDAGDVRAKVIGEGANLGVTQAGRIAFALNGGRINTDFIDNSAGVDCSDNEVNIKIALAAAQQSGSLPEKKRNKLLEDMTDEVAGIVLEDNRLQALALSIAQMDGAQKTASHARLIEKLEEMGALDRKTEGLADSETYSRRAGEGKGLTRPELAVLLSSAKLVLQDAIEQSELVKDKALEPYLIGAFPQAVQDGYRKQILGHRLRDELIATKLANRIINRLGLIHPFELAEEEGVGLAQIGAAFVAVEDLLGMRQIWQDLETADMPETARLTLLERAAAAMSSHIADLIRYGGAGLSPSEAIKSLGKGIAQLEAASDGLLSDAVRQRSKQLSDHFVNQGAPRALAGKVAHLFDTDGSIGLAGLARDSGIGAKPLTEAFITLGARLGLDWAQQTAEDMAPSDPWERLLVNGLARDFQHMRLDFLRRNCKGKPGPQTAVESWLDQRADAVTQFRRMIDRAQMQSPVAPAVLAQVAIQARNLLDR
ncbi:NAD-glutamate dehydrogenase [Altererythrobacter sp. BO-6]|uniref:NAD-glutamate dehydrogenase n=1 Tax=Altererythrobacter sp. BO-6 TaxID=2604537 RepID=UPI0013E18AD8|nr:NAD-glutamate dehydrogenase domain-containing protein [Altererythrobacter sp. BO-6]QIG54116.1 NAD-glutamate dehydrogenase [Altererythrobacter sp. BO-6]